MSADLSGRVPGLRAWWRGLRTIKADKEREDDDVFAQRAPKERSWGSGARRSVLDLGIQPPARHLEPPPLVDVARALAHFARFQLAAYGSLMYQVVNPCFSCVTLACCCLSHEAAFGRFAGIPVADIRWARTVGGPFKPASWVCLDQQSRSVVVSIRGTWSASDCVTDAFARQMHYGGYVVHGGLLAATEWVLNKVGPRLAELPELQGAHPHHVVTVGHSLGGAVAALLAMMLRDGRAPGARRYEAVCFSYGAPMLFDKHMAAGMEQFVVNVVHQRDMFPRISRCSVEELCDRVARLSGGGRDRVPSADEADEGIFHDAEDDIAYLPSVHMVNPGWQIYLQRRAPGRSRLGEMLPVLRGGMLRRFMLLARTPSELDMEICPSISMWPDHFPHAYLYMCEAFAERLQLQQGRAGGDRVYDVLCRLTAYWDSGNDVFHDVKCCESLPVSEVR